MRKVPFIDSTGIHNLSNLCEKCLQKNIRIVLSGVNPKVMEVLTKSGFDSIIGKENICSHITIALERARVLAEELETK
jgi:SulP family sulfate permease